MFNDNILFGHGPRMFRYLCSDEKYFFSADYNLRTDEGKKFVEKVSTGSCSTPHIIFIYNFVRIRIIGLPF